MAIRTVRTILNVGDSHRFLGALSSSYKKSAEDSLKAQYPGVTDITVTETRKPGDDMSDEPYTELAAEGRWDDPALDKEPVGMPPSGEEV